MLSLHSWIPSIFYTTGGLAPLFGLLIYALAHGGRLAKLISGRPLVLLGEASYALYILHAPLGGWFREIARRVAPSLFAGADAATSRTPSWGYVAVYLAVTLPICVLVFRYYETPSRYWIRKRVAEMNASSRAMVRNLQESLALAGRRKAI